MHEVGMKLGSCNNTFFINACLLLKKCAIARPDPNDVAQDALDGCYPYPKNIGEYGTNDYPGFSEMGGTSYKVVDLEFDMYLMFKPAGEGNEWVPLKKVHWSWSGAIKCINGKCTEDEGAKFFPQSIEAPDCSEYPIWHICILGTK